MLRIRGMSHAFQSFPATGSAKHVETSRKQSAVRFNPSRGRIAPLAGRNNRRPSGAGTPVPRFRGRLIYTAPWLIHLAPRQSSRNVRIAGDSVLSRLHEPRDCSQPRMWTWPRVLSCISAQNPATLYEAGRQLSPGRGLAAISMASLEHQRIWELGGQRGLVGGAKHPRPWPSSSS